MRGAVLYAHPEVDLPDGMNMDTLNRIFTVIMVQSVIDKRYDHDGWHEINHGKFKSVANDYKKYLNVLSDICSIEIQNSYEINVRSRAYRVNDSVIPKVRIITSPFKKLSKPDKKSIHKHKQLYWDLMELTIDLQGAVKFIDEFEKNADNSRARLHQLAAVNKIHYNDWFFYKDDVGGRLHTNLTNLKSELRAFLRYNGEKLIEIDIKNSQPYFLVSAIKNPSLIKKAIKSRRVEESIKERNNKGIKRKKKEINKYTDIYPLCTNTLLNTDCQDVKNFIDLTMTGQLYERFIDLVPNRQFSRDEAKLEFIITLFSSNHNIGCKKAEFKRCFKREFPNVYEFIRKVKVGDHSRLAILLQRIESWIVLEKVAPGLRRNIGVPIYTIHDSFLVPEGKAGQAKSWVENRITDITGYKPVLTTK